jgi:hypothetical protein
MVTVRCRQRRRLLPHGFGQHNQRLAAPIDERHGNLSEPLLRKRYRQLWLSEIDDRNRTSITVKEAVKRLSRGGRSWYAQAIESAPSRTALYQSALDQIVEEAGALTYHVGDVILEDWS